ncbi:MAG: General transcription factor IIH subunit 3 [Pycnora praestabilis]|nr:MAG: General transcription factor IIH subunit 3 [Pycnora praestabilis]
MNAVDGSEHYERTSDEPPPALLTIILDTNPHAWSLLSSTLPLSKAIANILVFINAHLAFNYANKVAVIASHSQRAQWLYPSPKKSLGTTNGDAPEQNAIDGEDIVMTGGPSDGASAKKKLILRGPKGSAAPNGITDAPQVLAAEGGAQLQRHQLQPRVTADDANKYRPFRLVEDEVMANLRSLMENTTEADLQNSSTTMMAGALTLALAYINKQTLEYNETNGGAMDTHGDRGGNDGREHEAKKSLQSRILVLSVSGDLAFQYIPVMNCIFAAQRQRIPIDILKLAGDTVFLQQASDATHGIYTSPTSRLGLLQYLMMAFLPDQTSRQYLVLPTQVNVDFRAACFCHKRVVDIGFVCSICLSIFCSPPEGATCLTCGTHLRLGAYGGKPAVVPKKKKKRKAARIEGGSTPVGTPVP